MKTIVLTILIFRVFLTSLHGQSGNNVFDNEYLHEICIYFPDTSYWESLVSNYQDAYSFSGSDMEYLAADILIDNNLLDSVGIRLRGKTSFVTSTELKKPMKIDFNEFKADQSYDGLKKLNLHNGACDPGMLRDLIGYNLVRESGAKAPRVSHSRLYINDEYWGLYSVIEQIDKTFIKDNFSNASGNLYKIIGKSDLRWKGDEVKRYSNSFEKKTNKKKNDWSDFIEFVDVLNNTPDDQFEYAINKVFNVDNYLHVLASDILLLNWDSYVKNKRNWYLYHNPESDLFEWIPWDYNLVMGGSLRPDGNPYQPSVEDCNFYTDFVYHIENGKVFFQEYSTEEADNWYWDIDTRWTSSDQIAVVEFSSDKIIEVCLTSQMKESINKCKHTRCKRIDLSFKSDDCRLLTNNKALVGSDPIFQEVATFNTRCCKSTWNADCKKHYYQLKNNLQNEGFTPTTKYDKELPLFINDSKKVLIDRILKVTTFRDRYLDIVCVMMDKYFTKAHINESIKYHSELIRSAIYEDPNYIFTKDYFEYDVGNGTGGGGNSFIPSLNKFLDYRIPLIQKQLNASGYSCSN